jgi:hypothetical protein
MTTFYLERNGIRTHLINELGAKFRISSRADAGRGEQTPSGSVSRGTAKAQAESRNCSPKVIYEMSSNRSAYPINLRVIGRTPFFRVILIAFLTARSFLEAQVPVYTNPQNLDNEYEMDRLMGDFPWAWRDRFENAVTAYRVTGGSLNIRHLYVEEALKVRFPLIDEKFWFRFHRRRRQGLERDDVENLVEFEYSPFRRWFFSILGDPAFRKAESDAGAAVRFGTAEGRSIKFTYLWPDFDTNYAYHNRSVNEGFEEFYRRLPQEARLSARWTGDSLSVVWNSRLGRAWESARQDFASSARTVRRGGVREASLDLRHRLGSWSWGLEGETWRSRESIDNEPAVPAMDRSLVRERSMARLSIDRELSPVWRMRVGGEFATLRGHERYPGQTTLDRSHRINDSLGFASLYHAFSSRWSWESGYMHDQQGWRTLNPGPSRSSRCRSENRVKLAIQRDLGGRSSFRLATGWELDKRDVGRFSYFDGGTLQFQTVF